MTVSAPGRAPARVPPVRPDAVALAPPDRGPLAAGVVAACWAAALGLVAIVVPVLVAWAAAPHDQSGPGDALRGGVLVWLLAHHADLQLPDGPYGLVPLGLLLVPALLLWRTGRWAGRTAARGRPADAALTAGALVAAYATVVTVLGSFAASPTSSAVPGTVLAGAAGLALLAGGAGVVAGSKVGPGLRARVPARVRLVARGAVAGVAAMLAGGALLVALALLLHAGRVTAVARGLGAGAWGDTALLLVQLLALPTAVVWGACYALGPGFAVGTGTVVAPAGVALGPLPVLPMAAGLPDPGVQPWTWLALAVPVVAAAAVGLVVTRPGEDAPGLVAGAGLAAAAGASAGLGLGALAALTAGPVGAGRLAEVGPHAPVVAGVGVVVLAVGAALVAAAAGYLRGRTGRGATAPAEAVPPVSVG